MQEDIVNSLMSSLDILKDRGFTEPGLGLKSKNHIENVFFSAANIIVQNGTIRNEPADITLRIPGRFNEGKEDVQFRLHMIYYPESQELKFKALHVSKGGKTGVYLMTNSDQLPYSIQAFKAIKYSKSGQMNRVFGVQDQTIGTNKSKGI